MKGKGPDSCDLLEMFRQQVSWSTIKIIYTNGTASLGPYLQKLVSATVQLILLTFRKGLASMFLLEKQ